MRCWVQTTVFLNNPEKAGIIIELIDKDVENYSCVPYVQGRKVSRNVEDIFLQDLK
jgi:hypothetical protein